MLQTALTLALLVGAGLLIRTMVKIANVPSGFNTGRILAPGPYKLRARLFNSAQGYIQTFHTNGFDLSNPCFHSRYGLEIGYRRVGYPPFDRPAAGRLREGR